MKPATMHRRACRLLGIDPGKVELIGPTEWKRRTGRGVSRARGVTPFKNAPHFGMYYYVRRSAGFETYVHELLHLLFPFRPHGWIYAASWKLCQMPQASWNYSYGRAYTAHAGDIKESRAKLLRLAHAAAQRRALEEES